MTRSQVTRWNQLEGFTKSSCGSWDLEARSRLPTLERGRGSSWSPRIKLGRGISWSSLNLHQNKPPEWLVHFPGHPLVLGQVTSTSDHKTHHGPDLGDATTIPHIVYSATLCWNYIQMALFPGTPKLESRNPPKCPDSGLPKLWEVIAPRPDLRSQRGLNRSCSSRQDFSNDISHSRIGQRELVDSRLLVVGSQTASLTPGPSFAHNLGYRCSNRECEVIFDIYVSRPFHWHQEHPNSRCFSPCYRALNIRESRKTPNPHFFQVLGFTLTLGQSRVATK
jgi:hypothetical protein